MEQNHRIAITGIGCVFPDASGPQQFWTNILAGRDSAREPPEGRWILSVDDAYSANPAADKVYSRHACFIDVCSLDTDGLAIAQEFLETLDPLFHLLLHAGKQAWHDANIVKLNPERVGIIIGNIVLPTETSSDIAGEILLPLFESQLSTKTRTTATTNLINRYAAGLPAGILAKALQLGGGSYTLDAACASSLYALKYAIDELQTGRTDAMLCGGLSRPDSLYTQMGFSSLRAISASGRCSPFDHKADGLVVGEGCGVLLLKRLEDALADGDHIYATIAGIGLSNDIGGNLMSPDSEGQLRAMRTAYTLAGWQPESVELIECHGTGTPVGDKVEFNSLRTLWGDRPGSGRHCVIGSVKSNIGHLLTAAGSAGLIKVLMSFQHKTLPPTANFEAAAAGIDLNATPFTVLSEARAWEQLDPDQPRRAAVSAFGFGGINGHVLLEEWNGDTGRTADAAYSFYAPKKKSPPAIAIIGMDACFGPWNSLTRFQHRVLGGVDDTRPSVPDNWWGVENRTDIKGYFIDKVDIPLNRFRIPPTELKEMLPQQLLMLQVAANAIDDAGLDPGRNGVWLNTGVYIGIGLDLNATNFHLRWSLLNKARQWNEELGLNLSDDQLHEWILGLRDAAGPSLTANRTMGALGGIVASRVARSFNMGGPSFTVASEESSGLCALQAGVRALQQGELDLAIAGAVDLAGDVRAALGQEGSRGHLVDGSIHTASENTAGAILGEGAAALVLKRHDEALRDGDRIYATVRGVGCTSGGEDGQTGPSADSCLRAMQKACEEAATQADSIGYIEIHGSGYDGEDASESAALSELFHGSDRAIPCAMGSVKADIGHAGAAAGMAAVAKTALCLYHEIIPPLRGMQGVAVRLQALEDVLFTPQASQYWLRNRAQGPRRAMVGAMGIDGSCMQALLEGVEQSEETPHRLQPLGHDRETLFSIGANTPAALLQEIEKLHTSINESPDSDIHVLSRQWWRQGQASGKAALALTVIAGAARQLEDLLVQAKQLVGDNRAAADNNIFYNPDPLGANAKLAWLFPGSGNHYPGMGRALSCRWPEVLRRLDRENRYLAAQFANTRFWSNTRLDNLVHRDFIFGQVWCGAMVSDVVAGFGLKPQAIIGHCLGESAGLFATRTWADRDGMLHRMLATTLFDEELGGPCRAARRYWGLSDDESVDWQLGVIECPADIVKAALQGHNRVYLLIINTPNECVIGGNRDAVQEIVSDLHCNFHPLEGVTTVHCEVVKPVSKAYRDLHLFDTTPPPGVTFYSGVRGSAYAVDRDSAADSILGQALQPFDYMRVIDAAYEDGIRVFIEMGPGASCCRMVDQILGDRPHIARAVCTRGENETVTLLRSMAQLNTERIDLDLSPLYQLDAADVRGSAGQAVISVAVGRRSLKIPVPQSVVQGDRKNKKLTEMHKTAEVITHPVITAPSDPMTQIIEQMAATEVAKTGAQELFLRVANGISGTLSEALATQMSLLQSLPEPVQHETPFNGDAVTGREPGTDDSRPAFDRDLCMEFAVGSIARVLGTEFTRIDTLPTRVRLPDEPLMLVDRILEVDATPCSMTTGRVVTEHDVLPGTWYLDAGRIPTCIAVEAGQADLFLCGYLGIDFQTEGLAVYRLLDAEITFHGPLPAAGDTIHYDIRIDHFFRLGETWLFRFGFEGTVAGQPLLTMRNGCAGFFTRPELAAGKGIVQTGLQHQPAQGKKPHDWLELVPMQRESYGVEQVDALRAGRLADCFGRAFAGLPLTHPTTLPGGRMTLVQRVLDLDPAGGRFGLGSITAEADIHPDDWFLTCHFVDDRVMPGTLMYECCLHTLRIYLLRMGWIGGVNEVVYEPLPGINSQLKCRGQVIETTAKVRYEIALKELGYTGTEQTPYVLADALMYADGRPIVQMVNMSLCLNGLTRERVESIWRGRHAGESDRHAAIFDRESILAFAIGNPSRAFGDRYRIFDRERIIARLPGPPYQFLDRIVSIRECEQWHLAAGGVIEAEYDVPGDAWYFHENRQAAMPFSVLLEVALQPCGWLAAYLGSALCSDTDLSFRNLGGTATQSLPVVPATGTLTTTISITKVSHSGGMIIQHYDYRIRSKKGTVYKGDTYFGFFTKQALSRQVGIQEASPYEPDALENSRGRRFTYPSQAPYPGEMLRMIDRVELFDPEGGPAGLGFIRGSADVNPAAWFFKAHFYQDPVWPGSLGLESMIQLLKVIACYHWGHELESNRLHFESMAPDQMHSWIYRGQIIPGDKRVSVQAVITALEKRQRLLRANGFLTVDGRIIYQMTDFTLRMAE
ncbi:MAG: beta-ketoacyl synthase N-terminal-like domain-containing protein [Gammaproteobacteria bacterium]